MGYPFGGWNPHDDGGSYVCDCGTTYRVGVPCPTCAHLPLPTAIMVAPARRRAAAIVRWVRRSVVDNLDPANTSTFTVVMIACAVGILISPAYLLAGTAGALALEFIFD